MIVVAIIGILAAVAIPSFLKYGRRSRTSEATLNVRKLFDGSVAYYAAEHADRDGVVLPHQFPGTVASSSGTAASACDAGASRKIVPIPQAWKHPTWQGLNFAIDDPHYYVYSYESEGVGIAAHFSARATGDLDCNGVTSTFERVGEVDDQNNVVGGAGIFALGEWE